MNILTLTLNPSIDHILSMDVVALHAKNILRDKQTFYGGKGVNIAFVLGKLGVKATALGLVGKKEMASFEEKLHAVGIETTFTPINGNIRQTFKVMESASGRDTEFNESGTPIPDKFFKQLMDTLSEKIKTADWIVLSGSAPDGVPTDVYADIIQQCKTVGVKTLLDTSGETLFEGAKAIPDILRINKSELNEIFPTTGSEVENILLAAQELHQKGIGRVVISMGSDGTIGFDGDKVWKTTIPNVQIRGLTGAGDAMTAGLIAAITQEKPFPECLKFSSALATASTQKLEPGDFSNTDLERIFQQVYIEELPF